MSKPSPLTNQFTLAAQMVAAAIEECPILADNSAELFSYALTLIDMDKKRRRKARRRRDEPARVGNPFGGLLAGGLGAAFPPLHLSREEFGEIQRRLTERFEKHRQEREQKAQEGSE